jgi:hypothetical protein
MASLYLCFFSLRYLRGADVCSFIRDKDPSGKGLSIEERKELNKVLGLMASVSPDCDFHPFDLEPEVTPSSPEQ